jgi:LuxR family maltose regulon positive regulatory protein
MIIPVLKAKLHKPQLPDHVISRTELLKDGNKASVIIVSAQAGSGKSTLVSAWLSEQSNAYCWYSLDEWDNDLTQFLTYLIAGVNSIDEEPSSKLEQMLEAFQSIGLEGFMKGLVHHLHTIDYPFILVFDDYQVIQNKQIHQVLRTMIEHMPKGMQLVLITREDPPLPLAKLRASKRLLEIRISDLKFTEDEVKEFFMQQLDLTLQEEQLQLVYKRTEGWIAGLQLAALSMSGLEDKSGFIEAFTGSHYYIMDYLIEEVLENQTLEIKEFLLKTAVLEFFTGELCDAVVPLEPGKGREIINRLIKTNIFIIPMESSREWYRYHQLFRDLLRERLEEQPKEDIEMLHRRAGNWFKAVGRQQEAIQHYLKAEAFEEAAALIECKWASMDMQLQAASWLDMTKRLPLSIIERSPVLTMGYGWALLDMGDVESSEVWLDKAQSLYELYQSTEDRKDFLINDTAQFELLPATVASARGYLAAATGDMEGVFKHTLDALAKIPSGQYQKRSVTTMLLAIAHWGTGELNEAETCIAQSIENSSHAESPLTYNSFFMVLGELYIQQGYLDKAYALFEQTIKRLISENQVPILLASLYLGLAKVAFLRGENQTAYTLLEDSKGYGQKYSLMDWKYKYYLLLARVYCSVGFIDLARDCVRESRIHYFMNPIPDDFSFEEMEASIDQADKMQRSESVSENDSINMTFLQEHVNRSLAEPLTVRELEVLTLIASGLSNREICSTLFLALSTVKGYNQTIYGKLQVKRRTEAVIKAKVLGLV